MQEREQNVHEVHHLEQDPIVRPLLQPPQLRVEPPAPRTAPEQQRALVGPPVGVKEVKPLPAPAPEELPQGVPLLRAPPRQLPLLLPTTRQCDPPPLPGAVEWLQRDIERLQVGGRKLPADLWLRAEQPL